MTSLFMKMHVRLDPSKSRSSQRSQSKQQPQKLASTPTVTTVDGKYYPAEDAPAKSTTKTVRNPTKIRASITPGTILILLAGRFRGKRVICLKALESGLLLVSGPYQVNGVPLRRVSPSYVIATSTKIDVSSVDVSAFDDKYFARSEESVKGELFEGDAPKPAIVSEKRKEDQKAVDAALMKVVGGVDLLEAYLKAKFSLTKNDKPHKMVF